MQLKASDVLSFDEIQAGKVQLFASTTAMSRQVKWVHVLTGPEAIPLLDGGEFLLTTGAGWPQSSDEIRVIADRLVEAGVAAIALELGVTFTEAPSSLIEVCAEADIALAVLHKEVRFVQITQRVHKHILASQNAALEARAEVHSMLTELGLNRSPVDYVVQQISVTLKAPVILHDIRGDTIAWASPDASDSPSEILGGFADTAKTYNAEAADPEAGQDIVRVEARGKNWGTLTALPGPPHPAGRRTVLELGAFALALGRLSDLSGDEWLRLSSKQLIETLLTGRFRHEVDLLTQLEAGGLAISNRSLLAVSLTGVGDFASHSSLLRAVLETALRRTVAPEGRVIIADDPGPSGSKTRAPEVSLLALVSLPEGDPRSKSTDNEIPQLAATLANELERLVPKTTPAAWRAHLSIGVTGQGVKGLLASLEALREAGIVPPWRTTGRVSIQVPARQPLEYLLRSFAGSTALQSFITEQIGALLEHDAATGPGHSGDLVEVLEAYLAHPNNKSQAASKARLSRSVFYQRLELIGEILGVDLNRGSTLAALQIATTARKL